MSGGAGGRRRDRQAGPPFCPGSRASCPAGACIGGALRRACEHDDRTHTLPRRGRPGGRAVFLADPGAPAALPVMTGPALIALTQTGADLARRIQAGLPGSRVHGLDPRVIGADLEFVDTADHLRRLFQAGEPIVGICAAGILIRVLAPLLADKREEPPVIAVADNGSAVVPLLGGHRGANDLAQRIADELGIGAALTTAGDVSLGFALDAPPPRWRVANPRTAKAITAALLANEPVALKVETADAGSLSRPPPSPAPPPPPTPAPH